MPTTYKSPMSHISTSAKLSIQELIDFDIRYEAFVKASRFVNYELIKGDILEFGVYTGRSLALLAHAYYENLKTIHKFPYTRNIIGFDSFEGLPHSDHPRWKKNDFRINHSYHPLLEIGAKVTDQCVYDLFDAYDLKRPDIVCGLIEDTLPGIVGYSCHKAALIHIDCDLYDVTLTTLKLIEPLLQSGTILLFDDWFNYRGDPQKGEAKALHDFLEAYPAWYAIEYFQYATFAKAFILQERQ